MMDIKAAREAYNEGKLNDEIWMRREYSIAYLMTNHTILLQLIAIVQTGQVKYDIVQ